MKISEVRQMLNESINADQKRIEDKVKEWEGKSDAELLDLFKQGYEQTPVSVRPHVIGAIKTSLVPIQGIHGSWEQEYVPRYNAQIDRVIRILGEAGF